MIQSAGRTRLVLESPRSLVRGSANPIETDRLKRDLPADRRIKRLIDHAHSSMADLTNDLVTPELFRNRRHCALLRE